ncbi:putative tRNA-intron endonuclease [Pseudoloma neurophilia]|uniref:tRNA-intron lyase n=1 Tax=Pseudoloma neurophilia TaxID=146866 RepID=A0A0R0LUF7_9MICR|nr:putative tRNA-intron endonuclease [Pseudoloma neurophilia]
MVKKFHLQRIIDHFESKGFKVTSGLNYAVDLLLYTDDIANVHSKYGVVIVDSFDDYEQSNEIIYTDKKKSDYQPNERSSNHQGMAQGDHSENNQVNHFEENQKYNQEKAQVNYFEENQKSDDFMGYHPHSHTFKKLVKKQDKNLTYRTLMALQRTLNGAGKCLILIDPISLKTFVVDRVQ